MLSLLLNRSVTATALLTGLAAACLAGCNVNSRIATNSVTIVAGFDTSASFRPHLPSSAHLVMHVTSRLNPGVDRLVLFRVDNRCEQFFEGPAPVSSDEIAPVLAKELKPFPSSKGTYPAAFFKSASSIAAKSRMPLVIAFMSDGDIDGHLNSQLPELKNAAQRLAENKQVLAVYLVGVSPANWSKWQLALAPLDNRLMIMPASAMSNSCLDGALQAAGR